MRKQAVIEEAILLVAAGAHNKIDQRGAVLTIEELLIVEAEVFSEGDGEVKEAQACPSHIPTKMADGRLQMVC